METIEDTNAKYEYLNAPCLLEDFKQTYLTSLNIFLNDEKFKEKTDSLPVLKSSAITKYEKLIAKEESERLKNKAKVKRNKTSDKLQPINKQNPNSTFHGRSQKKQLNKGVQIRYIIIDHELVEISLQAIEESNEINNKLTDPFNAYFHENNPKIRKKALEQIINNIMPDKSKKNISENFLLEDSAENNILNKDLEILQEKFKKYDEEQKKRDEKYAPVLKQFQINCDNHNIITMGQKIDYFVYLYNNGTLKNFKPKELNNFSNHKNNISKKANNKKYLMNNLVNNSNKNQENSAMKPPSHISNNNITISSFNYNRNPTLTEATQKYINELKNNFKIPDDFNNLSQLELYERELDNKIKSFQLVKKNLESSQKFIDTLRMYLRWEEVSPEKVILRNCDISSEKFYFLITKKYFDFSNVKHFNVANNNLGDIGGSYLLSLLSKFGTRIDYLNISYNKIGKQSCEILIDILQKNIVKLYGLSISGNKLGDKLFSEISIGISKNSYLSKLFVNDNDLGKISAVILGSILKYDKKIKFLDVSKNNFGDENIGFMLKGLICNTSLETLMINNMGLTNKSLRVFETTLCINSTLKQLFLERNKLNYKGWRLLSDILNKNKYIEYISLVGNNFENEHLNLIIDQQRQIKLRTISKTDYFLQITSLNEDINLYEYLE